MTLSNGECLDSDRHTAGSYCGMCGETFHLYRSGCGCGPCMRAHKMILRNCLTDGTKRLVRGLLEIGVVPLGLTALYIERDRYQGRLNKRAGEMAPTWGLYSEPSIHGVTYAILAPGKPAPLEYQGERYRGIGSPYPLTWIVKQDVSQWEIGPAQNEYSEALEVTTRELPPRWGF